MANRPIEPKPIIAVTGGDKVKNRLSWYCIKFAIWMAGGKARRITPSKIRHRSAADYRFDGVVVSGGVDIEPKLYGQPNVASKNCEVERDWMEHDIILHAIKQNKPVLGICRGAQMINVALGGTLYQEANHIFQHFIPTQSMLSKLIQRRPVKLCQGSKWLPKCLTGSKKHYVNSIHHQAIDMLGKGLAVSARDEFNIPQAIELKSNTSKPPFVLGVQWHPEFMIYSEKQRKIFKQLIKHSLQSKPKAKSPSSDLPFCNQYQLQ